MFLQRVLLDWLAVNSESEVALLHARHFYIGQWYREAFTEIMRQKQGPLPQPSVRKSGSHNKKKRKRRGKLNQRKICIIPSLAYETNDIKVSLSLYPSTVLYILSLGDESEEESSEESEEDNDEEGGKRGGHVDEALVAEVTQLAEKRKLFLLTKVLW